MQNLNEIIKIIQQTCADKNISVNKALTESGVGKDLIANMRKGQIPSVDKFSKLADYLSISVDCLLGRTDKPEVNK